MNQLLPPWFNQIEPIHLLALRQVLFFFALEKYADCIMNASIGFH